MKIFIHVSRDLPAGDYIIDTTVPNGVGSMDIERVIFNDPATIVIWKDGTKTIVKCRNEQYDPEKGLAMAIAKKARGNRGSYYSVFKKYLDEYKAQKLPEFDFGKQMTFSDALNNFKETMRSTFANNKNKEVLPE